VLLGVVLLVTHLVIRENAKQESLKDQAWAQTNRQTAGGLPRANDDFKIASKSASGGLTRTPSQLIETAGPVVLPPLNRSLSLPAQRRYPSYASPNVMGRVPTLNLPQPRGGTMQSQSLPVGFNLDECPAWGTLGTHSSMDSEEGTIVSSMGTNQVLGSSRPGSLPRSMPPAVLAPHLQPQAATPSWSVPPGIPEHGSLARTPTYERKISARTQSDAQFERPHPAHFPPAMMSPRGSSAANLSPRGSSAMMSPSGQTRQVQATLIPEDWGPAIPEDDPPVLLQWFPQASLERLQQITSSSSLERLQQITRSSSLERPQQITRSLSPVPRSQSNSFLRSSSPSPSFAPSLPRTPSPNGTPGSGERQVRLNMSQSLQPQATVRPAGNLNMSRDGKSASQDGFRGRHIEGVAQWFQLATPRPGLVPSQSSIPVRMPLATALPIPGRTPSQSSILGQSSPPGRTPLRGQSHTFTSTCNRTPSPIRPCQS